MNLAAPLLRSAVLLSLASLAACGGTPSGGTPSCKTVTRTCADVIATFSGQASSVQVTCDETAGTFTLKSTGVPNYTSNQTTPNAIGDQQWQIAFPLNPQCAATPSSVVASRGPVGFMVNGVPFYGPEDANGNDAVVNEGPSFDDCNGHSDMSCAYHYHEQPVCVFGQGVPTTSRTLSDGHPPVIGYALDGFALYAEYPSGISASESALDSCNGHSDSTRGYHFHATSTSPYLIGCYVGTQKAQVQRIPSCTP